MLIDTIKSLFKKPVAVIAAKPASPAENVRQHLRDKKYTSVIEMLEAEDGPKDAELTAMLAEAYFHIGEDGKAQELATSVLRLEPNLYHAHHVLSMIAHEAGRFEEALTHAHFAERGAPTADHIAQLGLCLLSMHRLFPARDMLRRAALLAPDDFSIHLNLGVVAARMGNKVSAESCFLRALELNPNSSQTRRNLEVLYEDIGRLDRSGIGGDAQTTAPDISFVEEQQNAIREMEEHFQTHPDNPDSALELAEQYLMASRLEEAQDILNIALANLPDNATLLSTQAKVERRLGRHDSARVLYEKALERAPDNLPAMQGLAALLTEQEDYAAALAVRKRQCLVDASPVSRMQLAAAETNACLYTEALATCDDIIASHPELEEHLEAVRAVSHSYLGNLDVAHVYLENCLKRDPNNTSLRFYRAMANLLVENYAEGWQDYHYRFLDDPDHLRLLPFPYWSGEDLAGKTILILAEQGLGDQVMFASCLPDLIKAGPAAILLEAHQRVAPTLQRSFPEITVIPSTQKRRLDWLTDEYRPDFYLPIGELARFFRGNVESFPDRTGYLQANQDRVAIHRARTAVHSYRVGISWRGGTQKTRATLRSISLDDLLPIFAVTGCSFINLQYGEVSDELREFQEKTGVHIEHQPEAIADLDEFAALVASLDLVITVCNTTVHYAGALGKEVWVMAPKVPEWRYGLSSPSLRWYPSSRIFRQSSAGDWAPSIKQIAADLARKLPR